MLDIEKAFDPVEHDDLLQVLEAFNFASEFIQCVKTFYCNKRSYVSNDGFLTE